mmetsp:Transcript_19784/g.67411  ORF Transcript_19784/g.67411 Transcript_19784/m.67411 type:complete len:286 (-) Transcript_19784:349-1206(-)
MCRRPGQPSQAPQTHRLTLSTSLLMRRRGLVPAMRSLVKSPYILARSARRQAPPKPTSPRGGPIYRAPRELAEERRGDAREHRSVPRRLLHCCVHKPLRQLLLQVFHVRTLGEARTKLLLRQREVLSSDLRALVRSALLQPRDVCADLHTHAKVRAVLALRVGELHLGGPCQHCPELVDCLRAQRLRARRRALERCYLALQLLYPGTQQHTLRIHVGPCGRLGRERVRLRCQLGRERVRFRCSRRRRLRRRGIRCTGHQLCFQLLNLGLGSLEGRPRGGQLVMRG